MGGEERYRIGWGQKVFLEACILLKARKHVTIVSGSIVDCFIAYTTVYDQDEGLVEEYTENQGDSLNLKQRLIRQYLWDRHVNGYDIYSKWNSTCFFGGAPVAISISSNA